MSFNEAACRSTRRDCVGGARDGGDAKASTRPRAGARGESWGLPFALSALLMLQRGRVPEHAESLRNCARNAGRSVLQRGRVPEHAESAGGRPDVVEGRAASTRPRAGARGEPDRPLRLGQHRDASTRPRAGARGEVRLRSPRHGSCRASTRPRAGARGEGRQTARRRRDSSRFNEAACRSTRRGWVVEYFAPWLNKLQRGRVPEHAERDERRR